MQTEQHTEQRPATPTAQVVQIPSCRGDLLTRARRKTVALLRDAYWRRRFAGFGEGSSIGKPDFISNPRSIWIGQSVLIWPKARIEALCGEPGQPCVVIGDGTRIQPYIHIGAIQSVVIGRGVLFASRVYITDHDHDWSDPDDPPISNGRVLVAPVRIGDYAWIGEGAMILKGVEVGQRSIIGAGSIVTHSVPPYCIAVGTPARVIRRYDRQAKRWQHA